MIPSFAESILRQLITALLAVAVVLAVTDTPGGRDEEIIFGLGVAGFLLFLLHVIQMDIYRQQKAQNSSYLQDYLGKVGLGPRTSILLAELIDADHQPDSPNQ